MSLSVASTYYLNEDQRHELFKNLDIIQQLFISVLHDNNHESWIQLVSYLESLPSHQLSKLANLYEIKHYVVRILRLAEGNESSSSDAVPAELVQRMQSAFPQIFQDIDKSTSFATIHYKKEMKKERKKIKRARSLTFSSSGTSLDLYQYNRDQLIIGYHPCGLTTSDLVRSVEVVKMEALLSDISSRPVLPTKRPTSSYGYYQSPPRGSSLIPLKPLDLPTSSPKKKPNIIQPARPGLKLQRILQVQLAGREIDSSYCPVLRTAEDVVYAFATRTLSEDVQEIYMNFTDTVPWNPYLLTVVDKAHALPEHFTATCFGILHVYPDGECEHHTFANWWRNKRIFLILREMKVFKEYLTKKMLRQWYRNVQQKKFGLMRTMSYWDGVRFHQQFSLCLWKVNSLSTDALSLDLFHICPLGRYTLSEFLKQTENGRRQTTKYLKKYFRYCLEVIGDTLDETHQRVEALENERKHKPFVSDLPISVQKSEHHQLERDLELYTLRKGQLKHLLVLCEQMVGSCITQLVQESVMKWMDLVLYKEDNYQYDSRSLSSVSMTEMSYNTDTSEDITEQKCLLRTVLEFTEEGSLSYTPSCDQLRKELISPLTDTIYIVTLAYRMATTVSSPSSSQRSTPTSILQYPGTASLQDDIASVDFINIYKISLVNAGLIDNLQHNEIIHEANSKLSVTMDIVEQELDGFCDQCKWLVELNEYIVMWESLQITDNLSLKVNPQEIKNALMKGYSWLNKLSQFPTHFVTAYSILCIETGQLISDLRPRLAGVLDWVQDHCIRTVQDETERLTELAHTHKELLSERRYDLEGFADYTQQLKRIKEEREKERETLDLVVSLIDMLTTSGVREIAEDNNKMEVMEKVWEASEGTVSEGTEFVEFQRPLKAQGLQESMEACEKEVVNLVSQLNEMPHKFPQASAKVMLEQIDEIHTAVVSAQSRLNDLNKWKQVIIGESYSEHEMTDAIDNLNGHKELWKCQQTFTYSEKEWLTGSIKKLNITDVEHKITQWTNTLNALPFTDVDPVYGKLKSSLSQYQDLVPVLKQVTTSALKSSDWKTLLSSVDVDYDPTRAYTLQDLLIYKVLENKEFVVEICQAANREEELKQSVDLLQNKWEHATFEFHQEPIDSIKFAFPDKTSPLGSHSSHLFSQAEKVTKFDVSAGAVDMKRDSLKGMLKVANYNEILEDIERDVVQLQIHCGSNASDNLKEQLHSWSGLLNQLKQFVELLFESQTQWWDTVMMFSELSSDLLELYGLEELQEASAELQKVMTQIFDDPCILSVLEKKRGQKGHRDLQGESLKIALEKILNLTDVISKRSKSFIEDEARNFPRLLFLSQLEILRAIGHRGNPLPLLPVLSRLFPPLHNMSVIDIQLSLDPPPNSTSDDGYQIVSLSDVNSEIFIFCVPLPIGNRRTVVWLNGLERAMRFSLSCHLTGCLMSLPHQFTMNIPSSEDDDVSIITWLNDNVYQAVMLAVEIKWNSMLSSAIEGESPYNHNTLTSIRSNFEKMTDYLVSLLRRTSLTPKVSISLTNLIIQAKNKTELIGTLMKGAYSLSDYPLYQLAEQGIQSGRLASASQSLMNSRLSIATTGTTPGKLHLLPEPLVGSTKSLLTSCASISQQASIKSHLPSVPSQPTDIMITCGNRRYQYGFEYMGMSVGPIPSTSDRCIVNMISQLVNLNGAGLVNSIEIAQEVAKILGRPYFSITCFTTSTTSDVILKALLASIQSGSILTLVNIDVLSVDVQLILASWLSSLYISLKKCGLTTNDTDTGCTTSQKLTFPSQAKTSLSSIGSLSSCADYKNLSGAPGHHKTSHPLTINRIDWYSGQHGSNMTGKTIEVDLTFDSLSFTVNANNFFGIIGIGNIEDITHELKESMRSTSVLDVDSHYLLECLLLSKGFRKALAISRTVLSCLNDLEDNKIIDVSVPLLKRLVNQAHQHLVPLLHHEDTMTGSHDDIEVQSIIRALIGSCHVTDSSSREVAVNIINSWFNADVWKETNKWEEYSSLVNAVKNEMSDRHLQCKNETIEKILEFHSSLQSDKAVFITGPSCCGKTSLYQVLAQSYNRLPDNREKIHIITISPDAYTINELFGGYSEKSHQTWLPGILTRHLQHINRSINRKNILTQFHKDNISGTNDTEDDDGSSVSYWIVLNGFDWDKLKWIEDLLVEPYQLELPNKELLQLPSSCRLLIETTYVPATVPQSFLSHSAIIKCQYLLNYHDLIFSWLNKATIQHNISTSGVQILSSLMNSTLPAVLNFVELNGNSLSAHIRKLTDINIHLILSFLTLLSAVFERLAPKQDTSSVKQTITVSGSVSRRDSVISITSMEHHVSEKASLSKMSHTSFTIEPASSNTNMPSVDKREGEGVDRQFDDAGNMSLQYQMTTVFAFALIWSFSGYINSNSLMRYSDKLREIITTLPAAINLIPHDGSVFDYCLDMKTYQFVSWNTKKKDKKATPTKYIALLELERLSFIIDLFLSCGKHVILIGEEGSGKTSFLKARVASTPYSILSSLTPFQWQTSLLTRLAQLKKRSGGVQSKKPSSQKHTIILDNLHHPSKCPYKETKSHGAFSSDVHYNKPPLLALISHLVEFGGLHDFHDAYEHPLTGIRAVGTSTINGVSNLTVSLLRHMNVVPFITISDEGLCHIMKQMLMPLLQKFPSASTENNNPSLANAISVASLTVLDNVRNKFSFSPSHLHYRYTLHDLMAVINGLSMLNPDNQTITQGGDKQNTSKTSSGKARSGKSTGTQRQHQSSTARKLPTLPESAGRGGGAIARVQSRGKMVHQHTIPATSPRQPTAAKKNIRNSSKQMSVDSAMEEQTDTSEVEEKLKMERLALRRRNVLRNLFRLWCHECTRVFADRNPDTRGRVWFVKLLETCVKYCYCGAELSTESSSNAAKSEKPTGGRRPRPGGRAIKKSASKASVTSNTSQPSLTLMLSELNENNINVDIMRKYLPKHIQEQYLTYEQIAIRGEDLSALIFSKLPMSNDKLSDYIEVGDGQVQQALNEVSLCGIILTKDGMEHAMRLSRALVIPGTHAILIGPRGVGRKTSCKLAAAYINAVLYQLDNSHNLNHGNSDDQLRELLKEASTTVAVHGKKAVVLIDRAQIKWQSPVWNDIIATMREGLSPDLFTPSELLLMTSKIHSLKSRRTSEASYNSLCSLIRPNLHIIITWDAPAISTDNEVFRPLGQNVDINYGNLTTTEQYSLQLMEEHTRSLLASLIYNCHYVNSYKAWSKNEYSYVALQYWQSLVGSPYSIDSSKMESLSYLAAHIHLSVNGALETLAVEYIGWVATVKDYIECLKLGHAMSMKWKDEYESTVHHLHSALGKLYDLERKKNNLKRELEDEYKPQLEKAKKEVDHNMSLITTAKERYASASQRCSESEKTIDEETSNVQRLKEILDEKFEKVAPEYYAALEALTSVDRSTVNEIMGYRAPPGPLLPVFRAICMLFDRPQTWADCQQLMLSQYFFQSLKFFDKDGTPQYKINQMEKFLDDQVKFSPSRVSMASQAVVPLVLWISSLVTYRRIKAMLQPYKSRVEQAEKVLLEAQKVYAEARKVMMQTKLEMEETVDLHKESLKKLKSVENAVQDIQKRMSSLDSLLNALSSQKHTWETKLKETQENLDCLPAHSLLIASSCTYLCQLPPELHGQVWKAWIGYCKGEVAVGSIINERKGKIYNVKIDILESISCQKMLSMEGERVNWEREEIFPDDWMLEKCLQWRTNDQFNNCCPQIVFDPLNFFPQYFTGIYGKDCEIHYLSMSSEDIIKLINQDASNGHTTVIDISMTDFNNPLLYDILPPLISITRGSDITILEQKITIKPGFKLFILLHCHPFSMQHEFVTFLLRASQSVQLTSLLFSQQSLPNVFLYHILQGMRRELCIQKRAMLADTSMHQQQINDCQESMSSRISSMDTTTDINTISMELRDFISETEQTQQYASIQIGEAQRAITGINQQIHPYRSLAFLVSHVFMACQQLGKSFPQVNIKLEQILDMLQSMIKQREGTRFHSSYTSLRAYLNHLETTIISTVHQRLYPLLFSHQHIYFPLLVALYKELPEVCLLKECLFEQQPLLIENLLDDLLLTSESQISNEYFDIDSSETINVGQTLEGIPGFEGLCDSLRSDKEEWIEYFKTYSSLLLPIPLLTEKVISLSHKLLLWKCFGKSKFFEAVQEYINLSLGIDCIQEHSIKIPPPDKVVICLFNHDNMLEYLTIEAKDRNMPMVVISALIESEIDSLRELSHNRTWILVNHLYHSNTWKDTLEKLNQILSAITGKGSHCFIPLPVSFLSSFANQVDLSQYHVFSLPNHATMNPTQKLCEYHRAMCTGVTSRRQLQYSIKSLEDNVNKISSLIPTQDCNNESEQTLCVVNSHVALIQCYLKGSQCYTMDIGHVLACVVCNVVPETWSASNVVNDDDDVKSLVDFIKQIRCDFYYD